MKKSNSNSIEKNHSDNTNKVQLVSKIRKELRLLDAQVWYDRHACRMQRIENGKIDIIENHDDQSYLSTREIITTNILNQAISAAKKVEKKYGRKNLGPWTDFEWGMINGKRSVLTSLIEDQCD